MAITANERTNIVKLVVSMFNAAPGATYLAELVTAYEAIGGTVLQKLSSLAISLSNTGAYKSLNPASQTAFEFASEFLSPFGLQGNQEAIDFVVAKINAGESKGQIAFQATVAINNSTAPAFAEARAILNNKAVVAEYFSITKGIPQTDLAQLQLVVASVTADTASVGAAFTAIDNGTGSVGFMLTSAAVSVEEAGTAIFELVLDKAPTSDMTVNYTTKTGTASGADFQAEAGSVTFSAGQTIAFVTINTTNDSIVETNETFTVEISGGQLRAPVVVTATITDSADIQANAGAVTLTTGVDVLLGNAGVNNFVGRVVQNINGQQVNQLGSGDQISGGAGTDSLTAKITSGSFVGGFGNASMPIQPETDSVEIIKLEAVSADISPFASNFGDNNTQIYVNAKEMAGVKELFSNYSDADLIIQNLTTLDNLTTRLPTQLSDMTIGMAYTGNADSRWDESDYAVYFDQDYLTPRVINSASVDIQLMNQSAYDIQPLTALGINPSTGAVGPTFISVFTFKVGDSIEYDLDQYLTRDIAGNTLTTYADALAAIKAALIKLKAANPTDLLLQSVEAKIEGTFFADIKTGPVGEPEGTARIGQKIILTAQGTTKLEVTALLLTPVNQTDNNMNLFNEAKNVSTTENIILSINVVLEKVGLAGDGGELIIGSMNKTAANEWDAVNTVTDTTSGIKQFDIIVKGADDKSSSLAGLHSTNNNLRIVNVTTDAAQLGTSFADLTIGNSNTGDGPDILETLDTTPGMFNNDLMRLPSLDNELALKDVQTFNASAFKGDLSLYAALTDEVVAKYLNLVDQSPNAPALDNVAFVYTGGTGNDYFNIAVDTTNFAFEGSVTREDMTIKVVGGAGNDTIVLAMVDDEPNFDIDDGGDNDTLALSSPTFHDDFENSVFPFINNHEANLSLGNVQREGLQNWYINQKRLQNVTLEGGAGDDTIWKPGSGDVSMDGGIGADTVYADNTGEKAVWVLNFNTRDGRALDDIQSGVNNSYQLFKTDVLVTFRGFEARAAVVDTLGRATDLQINQAVKKAINADPVLSKLLLAQDGPAFSLVVTSLIDGERVLDDFTVRLEAPTAAEITAGDAAVLNVFYGTGATEAQLEANFVATAAAFNDDTGRVESLLPDTTNTYLRAFARDAEDDRIDGTDSIHISDNKITGGQDDPSNDVLVLGTGRRSNDTVVYKGLNNGTDTIVNFDSTQGEDGLLVFNSTEFEEVTLTFSDSDGDPAAQTIIFDGVTVNLAAPTVQGVIPSLDVASQFVEQYNAQAATNGYTAVLGSPQFMFGQEIATMTGVAATANLTAGQTYTVAGLSFTSDGITNQAQLAEAFANLFNGSSGNATGDFFGTYSGFLTDYSTGAVTTTATGNSVVTFTSIFSGDVPDLVDSGDGAGAATITVTAQGTPFSVGHTVFLTRDVPGATPDVTAASFTGTYFEAFPGLIDGNGFVEVQVDNQGEDNVVTNGTRSTFTVTYDTAMTAVTIAGAATPFPTTLDRGDGSLTAARELEAEGFPGFTAGPVVSTPTSHSVTFTASGVGPTEVPTAEQFGMGATPGDGVVGSFSSNVGVADTTTPPVLVPAPAGLGTDILDFSFYTGNIDVVSVFVNGALVKGAATTDGQEYVTLTEGATGVYTIRLLTENSAGDTLVGVIGVADFGATQTFSAANFQV